VLGGSAEFTGSAEIDDYPGGGDRWSAWTDGQTLVGGRLTVWAICAAVG
jgi:hypothetical protein